MAEDWQSSLKLFGPQGGYIDSMNDVEERDHVHMLVERLDLDDPARRCKAAEALASYVGEQRFVPEVFEGPHPAAILAAEISRPKALKSLCIGAVRALGAMGPHAAEHGTQALTLMVCHTDSELRFEAIRALRYVGPGAAKLAAAPLAQVILDHDLTPLLRFEAARTLQALGPGAADDAAASLALAVADDDPDVQNASIQALGALGPMAVTAAPAAPECLVKALAMTHFEKRRLAANALGAMGEAAAEVASPALARLLRPMPGSDYELARLAAEALGAMGTAAIHKHQLQLSRALGHPDVKVQEQVKEALRSAGCERALQGSMALFDPEPEDMPKPSEPEAAAGEDGGDGEPAPAAVEGDDAETVGRLAEAAEDVELLAAQDLGASAAEAGRCAADA